MFVTHNLQSSKSFLSACLNKYRPEVRIFKLSIGNVGFYNRVEQSAKLIGVTGSHAWRTKLASNLNKRFYILTKDIFEKNVKKDFDGIKKYQLENCIEGLAKNVLIKLAKNADEKVVGSVSIAMEKIEPHPVWAYVVDLPLERDKYNSLVIKKGQRENLHHEARHLFDYITQPKRIASSQRFDRLENNLIHTEVFNKNLYGTNLSELKKEVLLPTIKNTLNSHFDALRTPMGERISVLQEFRYSLQSESTAKKDGIFYFLRQDFDAARDKIKNEEIVELFHQSLDLVFDSQKYETKKAKLMALKECEKLTYDYNVKKSHDEYYCFDEKIKILEEMIYENISKVRAKNKRAVDLKKKGVVLSCT